MSINRGENEIFVVLDFIRGDNDGSENEIAVMKISQVFLQHFFILSKTCYGYNVSVQRIMVNKKKNNSDLNQHHHSMYILGVKCLPTNIGFLEHVFY